MEANPLSRAPWKNLGHSPTKNLGGLTEKGTQLEHTYKLYTSGQLTGYIPVSRRCQTRHGRTDGQYAILRLAWFIEPLPDNHSR